MSPEDPATDRRIRKPDQRHLRRAADAAAGRDASGDLFVLVELRKSPPFDVLVFANEAEATERLAEKTRAANGDRRSLFWTVIPCQAEESAFLSHEVDGAVNLVLHDWWSPLLAHKLAVQRADVGDYILHVMNNVKRDEVMATVNLTELLRQQRKTVGDRQAQIDALFFSFEAADKFLMPHLAGTYGVKGGWQMRNLLKRDLGDTLRSDLMDMAERDAESDVDR
ncbi:MAG: hypothetical protein ABI910_23670 [Gemmatimonadota bacterium]